MTRRRLVLALGGLALWLGLAGCQGTGVYPLDIFVEMHYSPAFRRGEPPRLSPPADAVPITGREPAPDPQAIAQLRNPFEASPANVQAEALQAGALLYQRNCAMCHGAQGAGDGPMVQYFSQPPPGVPPSVPANLRAVVAQRSDGQLYQTIYAGGLHMPPFGKLLSSNEIWAVVLHMRTYR